MKRRGFLGALAAILGAPIVHRTRPETLAATTDPAATTFTVPAWVNSETALLAYNHQYSLFNPRPTKVGDTVTVRLPESWRC